MLKDRKGIVPGLCAMVVLILWRTTRVRFGRALKR